MQVQDTAIQRNPAPNRAPAEPHTMLTEFGLAGPRIEHSFWQRLHLQWRVHRGEIHQRIAPLRSEAVSLETPVSWGTTWTFDLIQQYSSDVLISHEANRTSMYKNVPMIRDFAHTAEEGY